MWWKFKKGEPKGKLRIKRLQVCWYDMENDGRCFDESFIENDGDEKDLLNKLGLWTTYVDMNDESDKNKKDRSRVFVHMDNGEVYELVMNKLSSEQFSECNKFSGGKTLK